MQYTRHTLVSKGLSCWHTLVRSVPAPYYNFPNFYRTSTGETPVLRRMPQLSARHLKADAKLWIPTGVSELGGARRDRTADPLLAKQVLSQLSYGPLSRER